MEYNITTIIQAVFALIAAVITVIVIPYIKSKTTAQQQAEINAWVKIAVSAAEQIYNGSGRGPEKKAYVLEWLKQRGITVDEAKLDAMIESAVYELKTGAHGQKAGNQTGRELNFSRWYNGSWLGVLRFKDRRKAELAAQACEAGVGNKNIGYDQDGRNTAYVAAEAVDFILSKIAKPVETDCSAFMMLCAISAGVDALKETYRKQGNSCTTYCMMRCFPATGEFELLTDRKYLTSDAYLRRGDILVSSGHTVMVLENGEKEDDDMDKATFTELFREMRKDLQDNDCSDWSEAARQWAVNNGIVQGGAPLPDGSANFMWQDMMTREQLVTVLYRFAQKLGMI